MLGKNSNWWQKALCIYFTWVEGFNLEKFQRISDKLKKKHPKSFTKAFSVISRKLFRTSRISFFGNSTDLQEKLLKFTIFWNRQKVPWRWNELILIFHLIKKFVIYTLLDSSNEYKMFELWWWDFIDGRRHKQILRWLPHNHVLFILSSALYHTTNSFISQLATLVSNILINFNQLRISYFLMQNCSVHFPCRH